MTTQKLLVAETLNRLAALQRKRADIRADLNAQIIALQQQADELSSDVDTEIVSLEKDVRASILLLEETVEGAYLTCVYTSGRVSWDTKALDGYAVAHPEVNTFRKQGAPFTTIREVKDK